MPAPLIAAMPNDVTMAGGYVVRIVAISPTDGSTVAGVRATDVAFQVQNTAPFTPGGSPGGGRRLGCFSFLVRRVPLASREAGDTGLWPDAHGRPEAAGPPPVGG